MLSARNSFIGFAIKTVLLFCFIYEFIPIFMPISFFSSRKIAFVIVGLYYLIKGYPIRPILKDKKFKPLFVISVICAIYILLLMQINTGKGELIISWYVFFIIYALLGPFLFAGLFNWNYECLLKSLAIVTVVQAVWCILTYYIYDFRILNSVLFVIDENENIDFLTTSRLRSIGGAGAGLSVSIALSSFSFLYFIVKGKAVILNIVGLLVSLFATILVATTGMLIFTVSIPLTMLLSMKKKGQGILSIALFLVAFLFLYSNSSYFFDDDQYERLTSKYISIFQDRAENSTVQALAHEQEISGITMNTIIGTGFSRGRLTSGDVCDHDGGYIRNYFGVGLIMALVFYFVLYSNMYKLSKKTSPPVKYLLLLFTLIIIGIEYKEPFVFYYIPVFLFMVLYLTEGNITMTNYKRS